MLLNDAEIGRLAAALANQLIGRIRNWSPDAVALATDDDKLLTTEQAASFLGCCVRTLDNNDIPKVYLPSGGIRFRLGTLRQFGRKHEHPVMVAKPPTQPINGQPVTTLTVDRTPNANGDNGGSVISPAARRVPANATAGRKEVPA